MVSKCANPSCSAPFRYLHQGRVFAFTSQSEREHHAGGSKSESKSTKTEYWWLCSECCAKFEVHFHGGHGTVVMPKSKRLPIRLVRAA